MKSGWKTSEFWAALGVVVVKHFFPDLDDNTVYAVIAYILSRAGVKMKNGG